MPRLRNTRPSSADSPRSTLPAPKPPPAQSGEISVRRTYRRSCLPFSPAWALLSFPPPDSSYLSCSRPGPQPASCCLDPASWDRAQLAQKKPGERRYTELRRGRDVSWRAPVNLRKSRTLSSRGTRLLCAEGSMQFGRGKTADPSEQEITDS